MSTSPRTLHTQTPERANNEDTMSNTTLLCKVSINRSNEHDVGSGSGIVVEVVQTIKYLDGNKDDKLVYPAHFLFTFSALQMSGDAIETILDPLRRHFGPNYNLHLKFTRGAEQLLNRAGHEV